jgi:hypothetical protein
MAGTNKAGALSKLRPCTFRSISWKNLRPAIRPSGSTQISVAPDGSPVFNRDLSTEEIYALTVKSP